MRLMVMAAERADTMAITIQRNCCQVGQRWEVKRAASNAPVRAKGSANTECSNLIISSTVRMRLLIKGSSGLSFFCGGRASPAEHGVLRQIHLSEYPADVLHYEIVDRFRLVIKRGNGRHD